MISDWRLKAAFPLLSRIPSTLPWRLAASIGREPSSDRVGTERLLQDRFAQVFPGASQETLCKWARAHVDMLAQEMVDALAFHRLGQRGGPSVDLVGLEHAAALVQHGKGFILVLNHYDRLLTAPVALAQRGIASNVLTMPILNNPDLGAEQRRFLMRKVHAYTQATRGQWLTSDHSLRPVYDGLRSGQVWVILADAWRPEFGRLRAHPFLGGELSVPTGIERLAKSTGVPLLQATTATRDAGHLQVCVEPLPENPTMAIDTVIERLARDVQLRPWAWWQWGLWEQMWRPTTGSAD